ncbi:hypothetical protein MPSI1_000424 [Malassezia psittaci]|uniref:FAM50A/XAP5 C-terminal domain-containing protein n=1 Tax=Malassezia psittaci TaxID=1821823 RepID=A0AAF0JCM7_9BASI|nr:hypothetical protein MPSI1_000424 [Malassezia psittaci]
MSVNTSSGRERFIGKQDKTEDSLEVKTVGLVRLDEFQRTRETLLEEQVRASEQAQREREKNREASQKRNRKAHKRLSFASDEEQEGDPGSSTKLTHASKIRKSVKDPKADTRFLPDREREAEQNRLRQELSEEWQQQQEAIKKEKLTVVYSLWDGVGHRQTVQCLKGDSIGKFLERCRAQKPQLRSVRGEDLLYVKEDLIIPHNYTFYDLITSNSRGKSGPLFHFDVHDDVRLLQNAAVEKDESHAGKVVERSWYNRNKHIFPASRWEVFDPIKNYGAYRIAGS